MENKQKVSDFQIGQRTFVGGGEQSFGTVVQIDAFNVYVKLDSDGETVVWLPPNAFNRRRNPVTG